MKMNLFRLIHLKLFNVILYFSETVIKWYEPIFLQFNLNPYNLILC